MSAQVFRPAAIRLGERVGEAGAAQHLARAPFSYLSVPEVGAKLLLMHVR